MASTKECGLYRTTKALPGHEEKVPAGMLVYFHNHPGELPEVIPADHNVHNRWHFHPPGIQIRGTSWIDSLERMPDQGFYVLSRDVPAENGDGKMTKGTLVQLGYQNTAKAILFMAREPTPLEENKLFFAQGGMPIARSQLSALQRVKVHKEHGTEGDEPHVH